jgi:hypothetical protein
MLTDPLRGGATRLFGLFLLSGFALQGSSESLLTPLPGSWMAATIVPAMIVAVVVAYTVAAAIPSLLVRRLTTIGVLSASLYSSGQLARGLYVMSTFSGTVERAQITLLVTGGGSGSLQAVDPTRPGPVRTLPASADEVRSAARGQCVSVTIERAPGGAERLVGAKVTPEDISPCE